MIYYKKKAQQDVGATAIEYGLLSALIAVAMITGLQLTGVKLDNTYCYIATKLSQAVGGAGGGGCSSSANKSASSAKGSSSDSDSSKSSADSSSKSTNKSSSSDSSSGKIDPHTYSYPGMFKTFDRISLLRTSMGFTKISGLYDVDGNPVTNTDEIAKASGLNQAEYDVFKKNVNDHVSDSVTGPILNSNSKWIYIASMKNVKFYKANGDVYTYNGSKYPNGNHYFMWKDGGGNSFDMTLDGPCCQEDWNPNRDYGVNPLK